MNYIINGRNCPILIKGVLKTKNISFDLENLKDRIKKGLLTVQQLSQIMFHVTILVSECERRNPKFLISLRLDQIYLNKNQEDTNVFIFEEDQQNITQKQIPANQILQKLFLQLGFNLNSKLFEGKNYVENIIEELIQNIFEEKKNDCKVIIPVANILKVIFNFKILKTIYDKKQSRVYLIQTPYFINNQRNQIIVKWLKYDKDQIEYQNREIQLLELVNDSENCTNMFCYSNYVDEQLLFMKYYDLTLEDLNNIIGKKALNLNDLLHIIIQIILALKGLHCRKIIHRDLKPQNIMFEYLNENQNILDMRCVLIDFDRSKLQRNDQNASASISAGYEGTPGYQPPEGTQDVYNASYDIWQLGYIIQCILIRNTNSQYSKAKDRPMKQNKYAEIFKKDQEQLQQNYPQFSSIIMKMMNHDPNLRPNLEEIENYFLNIQ